MKLLNDYGFNTINLNRIFSGTPVTNNGANKICEKNEMEKHGLLLEAFFKNGKYLDVAIYSILLKDLEIRNQKN